MVRESCKLELEARAAPLIAVAILFCVLGGPRAAADGASAHRDHGSALTAAERGLVASVPYSSRPLDNRSGDFDTRFSAPPDLVWQDLYERPAIISLTIAPAPANATHVESVGDVQGVFPIEAKYYLDALIDYSAYPEVTPRTIYDVGRGEYSGPHAYHKRIVKISGRFLGFGDTYLFVTNNYAVPLGEGSYGLKWNLEKSLDGKFYSLMGSWYLKSLRCDGKPCTYVRYFNQTGFTKRPPVPTSILAFFTGASFRDLLREFYQAARLLKHADVRAPKLRASNTFLTNR